MEAWSPTINWMKVGIPLFLLAMELIVTVSKSCWRIHSALVSVPCRWQFFGNAVCLFGPWENKRKMQCCGHCNLHLNEHQPGPLKDWMTTWFCLNTECENVFNNIQQVSNIKLPMTRTQAVLWDMDAFARCREGSHDALQADFSGCGWPHHQPRMLV